MVQSPLPEMVDVMDYTHKYVPMNQYQDIQGQESVVVQLLTFIGSFLVETT